MVIDWIFGLLILIFAIIGLVKGFIDNLFNKLSWILGLIAACFLYDYAGNFIPLSNKMVTNILGFLIVFIIIFLVIKLIQFVLSKVFSISILKSLDRILGFALGAIEGVALVGILVFILIKQPFFPIDNLFQNSFAYSFFENFYNLSKEIGTNV